MPQTLDFVLHLQLASLQLRNFEPVGCRMGKLFLDLLLQGLMLALEVGKLRPNGHEWSLPVRRFTNQSVTRRAVEVDADAVAAAQQSTVAPGKEDALPAPRRIACERRGRARYLAPAMGAGRLLRRR
jgi:hypothetical protein